MYNSGNPLIYVSRNFYLNGSIVKQVTTTIKMRIARHDDVVMNMTNTYSCFWQDDIYNSLGVV